MGSIGNLIGLLSGLEKFKRWIALALGTQQGVEKWRRAEYDSVVDYEADADDAPIRFPVFGDRAELVRFEKLPDGRVKFALRKMRRRKKGKGDGNQ